MATDRFGQPYGSSWAGMSMGEGRRLEPYGECPSDASPDGKHHYISILCVQSVETFQCEFCHDEWTD